MGSNSARSTRESGCKCVNEANNVFKDEFKLSESGSIYNYLIIKIIIKYLYIYFSKLLILFSKLLIF